MTYVVMVLYLQALPSIFFYCSSLYHQPVPYLQKILTVAFPVFSLFQFHYLSSSLSLAMLVSELYFEAVVSQRLSKGFELSS